METNYTNNLRYSHIRFHEESYGRIKRTYPKPTIVPGCYEALSLIK